MPDANGNFKPFALSRKAAATYDRIFPKKCVREGSCFCTGACRPNHVVTSGQWSAPTKEDS